MNEPVLSVQNRSPSFVVTLINSEDFVIKGTIKTDKANL